MNRAFSIFISGTLAILFIIQLSSVVLTGVVADYRFYENFSVKDVLSVSEFFKKEGVLLFIALVSTTLIIQFAARFFAKKAVAKSVLFTLLLIGVFLLSTSGGIINNAYATARLKLSEEVSINQALNSLGIGAKEYKRPNKIKASSGKNIIVLSLESFEKGYLGDKLKHLTPNLRQLSKQHQFYNMKQTPAGGWTSASMYTALTGVPAFFGGDGNSVFQRSYENKITSLPTVLKKAGYDLQYFLGKKEYSGIDDMLTSMNFNVKSEKDFETKYSKVPWGIQDKDLFEEFKKELLIKKDAEKPFALFLSTISTHFPNGVPDKRIDSLLPPQRSRLELMVSATDYFVGDLIGFLEEEGFLSNTTFFIYPDHLLMGDTSAILKDIDERELFFLTNSPISISSGTNENPIYQIDIPKLILQGAQVNHNAKFLTDFIVGRDKISFLNENKKQILQLNNASLKTLDCKEGVYIEFNSENRTIQIKNNDDFILLEKEVPSSGNSIRVVFDEKWRIREDLIVAPEEILSPPSKLGSYLDVFISNELLYGSLKGSHHFGTTKRDKEKVVFDKNDFSLLKDIALSEDKRSSIIIKSNSWHAKKPSSYTIDGEAHNVSRGLTVIIFNSTLKQRFEFRTFDTYGNSEEVKAFLDLLTKLQQNEIFYIIMAHDAASQGLRPFKDQIKDQGFTKLSSLPGRSAYIAHNLNGEREEFFDKTSISKTLVFPEEIKNTEKFFQDQPIPFVNHNSRFIAHAGGEIGGIKYTNTIEALNTSYALGFRLFELDIEKTKDNHFVATHDWKHWAKQTGYKGDLPVTLSEFLEHKIYGKYSPLDLKGINQWFREHPDATLITDKINEPADFANAFIDKSRLLMELFSLNAIEEASNNGIRAIVSGKPLSQLGSDPISYFKKHNLKYVAISRRNIAAKKRLLKKLRENDIKVYVYSVNFDAGRDENYVFQNEIGIVYGMYADKWITDFDTKKQD